MHVHLRINVRIYFWSISIQMIKGAKKWVNKFTGEEKQICPKCGRRMPLHYYVCLGCQDDSKAYASMKDYEESTTV